MVKMAKEKYSNRFRGFGGAWGGFGGARGVLGVRRERGLGGFREVVWT